MRGPQRQGTLLEVCLPLPCRCGSVVMSTGSKDSESQGLPAQGLHACTAGQQGIRNTQENSASVQMCSLSFFTILWYFHCVRYRKSSRDDVRCTLYPFTSISKADPQSTCFSPLSHSSCGLGEVTAGPSAWPNTVARGILDGQKRLVA